MGHCVQNRRDGGNIAVSNPVGAAALAIELPSYSSRLPDESSRLADVASRSLNDGVKRP